MKAVTHSNLMTCMLSDQAAQKWWTQIEQVEQYCLHGWKLESCTRSLVCTEGVWEPFHRTCKRMRGDVVPAQVIRSLAFLARGGLHIVRTRSLLSVCTKTYYWSRSSPERPRRVKLFYGMSQFLRRLGSRSETKVSGSKTQLPCLLSFYVQKGGSNEWWYRLGWAANWAERYSQVIRMFGVQMRFWSPVERGAVVQYRFYLGRRSFVDAISLQCGTQLKAVYFGNLKHRCGGVWVVWKF